MERFKILVADDDQDDFLTIQEAFFVAKQLPELEHVQDGKQLLEYLEDCVKLQKNLPDLVLLDINMPRMDGIEALEKIKKTNELSKIPVLIYSTSSDKSQMQKCYGLGADGFITKGYSFSAVISFVNKLGDFLANRTGTAIGQSNFIK